MSKETMKSTEIQRFLKDWEAKATTELLEEGKEFDELIEIADARGIKLKDNKDLAGIKFIYAFADEANKNGAILPTKELLKALPSMIGKPLDLSHERGWVVGHFLDYKWIVKEKKVIAYAVIYKSNFAEEWEQMQGLFKAGKLFTSFEIWSDHSKRKVNPDGTYELYDMTIAGGAILINESPAFPGAKVLEMAKDRMLNANLVFASEIKDEDIITAENISKATELPKDNVAIQTVVEGEKKVEIKKEEVVVAPVVEAAAAVETPKVETPKAEEKIAEATVPAEETKPEEAKTVIETKEVKTIEDSKKDPVTNEVTRVETIETVVKVTDTYKAEQPVAVAAEAKVEEPVKVEAPAPVVETPKVEAKVEEPKAEEPKAEAKVEEPKVEAPAPVVEAPKECAKCKELEAALEAANKQTAWYKENAAEIAKRRTELGDAAKEISDVDILDNAKFSDAKVAKANLETAKEIVGKKVDDVDEYKKYQDEITAKSEGRIKRNR